MRQVTSKRLTHRRKTREFTVVIERDEDGWYVGTVPELRACYTQARSLDELAERMKEVIALCLEHQGATETEQRIMSRRFLDHSSANRTGTSGFEIP